jgi:hypothetical protein
MPNQDKFKELVLYVARESEDDPKCGATKLNEILFYADFHAYRKLGRSISGETYQKLGRGPAPKRIVPVIAEMEATGLCVWAERDYYGFPLKKLIPLREPDLSVFTAQELNVVRSVISKLRDLNATEVSDLPFQLIGWQLAEEGEDIPYSTAFLGHPRPPTPAEVEYGRKLAEELGE